MAAIVIAEDDPDIRDMIATKLSRSGHHITATSDGAAAIIAIRRTAPDAVVLDMQMPGLSGLDVLRLLRVDPHTARVPVIMASAHCEPSFVGESFHSGVNDFLAKPFSPKELAARLERLLAENTSTVATAVAEARLSGRVLGTPAVSIEEQEPQSVNRRGLLRFLADAAR